MSWESLLLGLGPGVLASAVLCWAFIAGHRAQRALVRVQPAPLLRPLCVLMPARNEAMRLPSTLDALLKDTSAHLHVVVYNDASSDETGSVLEKYAHKDPRLVAVDGAEKPLLSGFGKPAALSGALSQAQKESWWDPQMPLLCLDADVELAEGALGGLLEEMERSGAAALSGMPRLILDSWVERLWVPSFVALALRRFSPARVHHPGHKTAFLNGQLMMLRFDALQSVGGFASVADAVLEDVALGEQIKSAGYAIRLADLRQLAATRMYVSFSEIAAGFGKNAVPLQGGVFATLWVAASGWSTSMAVPWSIGFMCLHGPSAPGLFAAFCSVLMISLQLQLRRQLGVPVWPALLAPIIYLGIGWVYLRAAWRVWRGGTLQWRGRDYRASRR